MKTILSLSALLITLTLTAQSWTFSEGGDAFDGKYKTSSVIGKGTDYPYTKPLLVINKFEGEENINFYISGGGYFQEKTGISVLWVFDNEPNKIYSTYDWTISSDGKILFFREFNNPDGLARLKPIDIIDKLTLANKVTVRMKDDYGSNDIVFSLSGSSKAINSVIPQDERKKIIDLAKADRDAVEEEAEKNQTVFDELMEKVTEEKLSSSSVSLLKSSFQKDLGLSYYTGQGTGKNYKTISVEGKIGDAMFESYGYVDIYYVLSDGSKEKIYGTWSVEKDAPVFERVKEEVAKIEAEKAEKEENDKQHLIGLLKKYQRADIITHLSDKLLKEANRYNGFSISSIKDIKIILSGFKYGYFWDCKINIYLEDGSLQTVDNTYIYSSGKVEISKKELKAIGGKADVEF
jgi:hypothetical protein